MSIFGKPPSLNTENEYGVKIMFLHGLEGSSVGSKATHLKEKWSASCPPIRTSTVMEAREKCAGVWSSLSEEDLDTALSTPFSDVVDAVNYFEPDIIVGSSLGAAMLYKLYAEGKYSSGGVFLAPAVPHLLSDEVILDGTNKVAQTPTTWILGETDTIVPNNTNAALAKSVGGNLIYSPDDCHRLHKALSSGLIDAAILTVIEEMNRS
tara:strand:+ start:2110 stop:2733 length:624 start_codon:yes stop_codon:yes gene_type:complete